MKPTRTTIIAIIVSLITVAVFVFWKTGVNYRSLFPLKNSVGEDMRRLKSPFKKTSDSKCQATPCSAEAKRQVFIDWRRLYWGNLGDLTKPERFFAFHNPVQTTGAQNVLPTKNEALQQFTQELRAALKAFEERYFIKIDWRKKDLTLPDVTTQFINFWDKDFQHLKERGPEEKSLIEGGKK